MMALGGLFHTPLRSFFTPTRALARQAGETGDISSPASGFAPHHWPWTAST